MARCGSAEIGKLVDFKSGGTPSKTKPEFWGGNKPWISGKDLKQHYISSSIDMLSEEGFALVSKAPKGASLILVRGMTLLKDFPVGFVEKTVSFNQDIKALIPKKGIDGLFLSYLLVGKKEEIRQLVSTAGHGTGRLDTESISSFPVDIPPLPEQKKIAQILSTWDKAITTTEQLLANSQQQKKALMQQLRTGKKQLKGFSGEWKTVKLGRITEKVGSGITPTGGSSVYTSSGIPFIRSQNVLWGKLDFSDIAYINDSQHKKMSGSSVLPNDVLLNITGASIGRCCTVPGKLKTSNVNQHVCIIRPKKGIGSDYLKFFLLSHYGQKQIEQFQAGGNRQGLNFEQIKSFKIHIPELEEQQKIAAVLSAADCEIEVLQQKLEGLKQEKKALMQQLLTGKLRVKV